jgi:hypothetical protein
LVNLIKRPVEYLVRIGDTSQDFTALSDPPLSELGIAQAQAVAEFLGFEGIKKIEFPQQGIAAFQFARILLDSGLEYGDNFPTIKIMAMEKELASVFPGGIIAVYLDESGEREFVPCLNAIPVGELN